MKIIPYRSFSRFSKWSIKVLLIISFVYITGNFLRGKQNISDIRLEEIQFTSQKTSFDRFREQILPNLLQNGTQLQIGRRNHDLLIMDESVLVNIAGCGIATIETLNLFTGERSSMSDGRLDLNHITAVHVHDTIFILCGFNGESVNGGNASEFMYMFDWRRKLLEVGPRMRIPRGACGGLILNQMVVDRNRLISTNAAIPIDTTLPITWIEDLICVFGGSIGTHDNGAITSDADCYSIRGRGWIVLPSLPAPLDHLVVLKKLSSMVKTETNMAIPSSSAAQQSVIAIGGRTQNYKNGSRELYELSLQTGQWTRIMSMEQEKSAFGSVIVQNRYVITFGGVRAGDGTLNSSNTTLNNEVLDLIEVCDLETQTCRNSERRLNTSRFATMATKYEEAIFVCGGTRTGTDNLSDCEVFDANLLILPHP